MAWAIARALAWSAASPEAALIWLAMTFPATRVRRAVTSMAASSQASRLSTGLQPVADAPQRRDPHGIAEFLAQADDVDIHGLLAHEPGSPDLIEQLLAGERAARAGHQRLQQVELPACQVHRGAADSARPAAQVQLDRPGLQRAAALVGEPAGAAQVGPDPGNHLVRQERLDHVIVSAQLQAGHPAGLLTAGGQQD